MMKQQILLEAIRIERELENLKKPNSPYNTHYMARISPIFAYNATQKDMDDLLSTIRAKDATISTLKKEYNMPGLFVFTNKKLEPVILKNNGTVLRLLRGRSRKVALLLRENGQSDPTPYIVALGFERQRNKCSWMQGHYFSPLEEAVKCYLEYTS